MWMVALLRLLVGRRELRMTGDIVDVLVGGILRGFVWRICDLVAIAGQLIVRLRAASGRGSRGDGSVETRLAGFGERSLH